MTITSLKQQVKNPERVSIFVDGKYGFSFSLDELTKYKIKNGDELTEADLKKYKKISEDGKLKAKALAWVLGRPHSTRELADYMFRKKAEANFTQKLIEEFTQKKYLNDKEYGKWLYELRARGGKSNRAIKAELFRKGINREMVDELMEDEEASEVERVRELIAKKQKLLRYKNDELKLKQYLVRQGFSYELVNRVLKQSS